MSCLGHPAFNDKRQSLVDAVSEVTHARSWYNRPLRAYDDEHPAPEHVSMTRDTVTCMACLGHPRFNDSDRTWWRDTFRVNGVVHAGARLYDILDYLCQHDADMRPLL